jgi:iron complex outermembrane recepter protein
MPQIRALLNIASTRIIVAFMLSSIPLAAHSQNASGVPAGAAVASPVPASASGSPETVPSGAADAGLAEIVVTAEKRRETTQRVPAAVSVVSGETLVERGVVDLTGIENLMPSAKMNIENSVIQVFIRGIGSQLDYPFIPTSVGVNLDGGSICRYCASGAFYDIQRVEVLPGPQGTLYGSSAIGGVVNILTNRPTHEWMTDAIVDYGNYNTRHETLVENVPVTPDWSLRGAVDLYDDDGFNNNGTYDQHSKAGRLSSLYTSDNLSAFLTASYFEDRNRPSPTQYDPIPTIGAYNYPATEVATAFFYPPTGLSFGYGNSYAKNFIASGQFDLTLGDFTISYLPADLPTTLVANRFLAGFADLTDLTVRQFSNELRASGNTSKINWVAGLYQLWDHSSYYTVFGPNLSGLNIDTIAKSYAAYGQLTYSVTDKARLTAGARESRDSLVSPGSQVIVPTATFGQVSTPFTYNDSWSKFDWKVGGEYDVAPNSMLYVTVQTGFNPGTFRTSFGTQGETVDPQTMLGYTGGIKNRFFNSRLQFNLEGFYYNYKELPVNALDLSTGILTTINAPDVHIKGVQADLAATPVRNLQFSASFGYLDAKFIQFEAGGSAGNVVNYAGYELPYAPELTVTLGAQYTYEFAGGGSIRAGVNSYLSSSYWDIFSHTSNLYQPSYSKTDLNLTLYAPSGRWDIGGYAKNLENTASQAASAETGRPYPYAGAVFVEAPRQFGVKLHVKF